MKTTLAITTLLAALALAPAAAGTNDSVTVTLDLDLFGLDYKECDATVPAGANAGAVLDAAVASGCISEWSYQEYDGLGRYVTSIDGVPSVFGTYWGFFENGDVSQVGIDLAEANEGDVFRFNYDQWVTLFVDYLV